MLERLFPIISSFLLIILAMCSYLTVAKTKFYVPKKVGIDIIFALFFGIVAFYCSYHGVFTYNGQEFSMIFIVIFVVGLLFDFKYSLISLAIAMLSRVFGRETIDNSVIMYVDLILLLLSLLVVYIAKNRLFKKTWPPISSCFMFAFILTSIYMLVTFVFYGISNVIVLSTATNSRYLVKLVQNTLSIYIILAILNIFFKKDFKTEANSLLVKIFKKFSTIAPIIFIIVTISIFAIYYISTYNIDVEEIKAHSAIAKVNTSNSINMYGNDFMDVETARITYKNWLIADDGVLWLVDTNGTIRNEFQFGVENSIKDIEHYPNFFDKLDSYPEDEIIQYNECGYRLVVSYYRAGNYKVVLLVPKINVLKAAFAKACNVSHTVVFMIAILYMVVQSITKRLISNRLDIINKKLRLITNGNYDVKLFDDSSTELTFLSDSINKTVGTLKSKIEEIRNREKEELELARRIQVAQLPEIDECNVSGKISAENIPAEDIGGDFYDFFSLGDKLEVFLMADVSGKGVPGAMFMMRAKNTIRNVITNAEHLDTAIKYVNGLLCEDNDTMMFVTCFVAAYNKLNGKLRYINAGHNPPIFCKKNNNAYDYDFISTTPSPILGIDKDSQFIAHTIQLEEGDGIFLYTDGITESRNVNKEFFGEERLLQEIKKHKELDTNVICNDVIKTISDFSKGADQHDDITLLCFKYTGRHNEIIIKADESNIAKGRKLIDRFCDLYNITINMRRDLKVVYDEIFSNIMKYAYGNNGGDVIFKLNNIDSLVEMVFIDNGPMFNPIAFDSTDIHKNADDKINGGMGIMFCKNIMDDIKYDRMNNQNILSLYKKI